MRTLRITALLSALLILFPCVSRADTSGVCAAVKIEIVQELTLERQAFDARMGITNSSPEVDVTSFSVQIWIRDEFGNDVPYTSDPNDLDALFFVRQSSLTGISSTDGTGIVNGGQEAEARWLLIPAPGASQGRPEGARYAVGADVSYNLGGEPVTISLTPDTIVVRPMPELRLDYFLTEEVRADDPFTPQVEQSEEFPLGVRVLNSGFGVAHEVQIESAQPRIVENDQELLIGFKLTSSYVNDEPVRPSLLIPFGDIEPGSAAMGRWLMETTLSGTFVDFTATFTHAPEYGGRLTSLIIAVNTHSLVRDVKVDLPGRDDVRDFLASDDGFVKLFESNGLDTAVRDYTGEATLIVEGEVEPGVVAAKATLPPTAGPLYISLPDPFTGTKEIIRAKRSDGKQLLSDNFWTAASGNGNETQFFVRLFDVNGGGTYTLFFSNIGSGPKPPVLQFISDKTRPEGKRLTFIVEASDPNGTVPALKIDSLPIGATFTDNHNGTGIFDWMIPPGVRGQFPLVFRATDGALEAVRTPIVTVTSLQDSDGDNLSDEWEQRYFGNLDRDGNGDFDGDGLTDREEYELGTDPTFAEDAPRAPEISAPLPGAQVPEARPFLVVRNSVHSPAIEANYQFELFIDDTFTTPVATSGNVSEDTDTTSWQVPSPLLDNTWYFWRVRVVAGPIPSEWAYGQFFRNAANDPPTAPIALSPTDGEVVAELQPTLSLTNATDIDGDLLTYGFEVRRGTETGPVVAGVTDIGADPSGTTSWPVGIPLEEDVTYLWRGFATDPHGEIAFTDWEAFIIDQTNTPPPAPIPLSPADGSEVASTTVTLEAAPVTDPEDSPVTYFIQIDEVPTFNSAALRSTGPLTETAGVVTTSFSNLRENRQYYWRVKANDGSADSPWNSSSFIVNAIEEAPSTPTPANPSDGSWVETTRPALQSNPSTDPDGDTIQYEFQVSLTDGFGSLAAQGLSNTVTWIVPSALTDNTWYFWRVRAVDSTNRASGWSVISRFFVNADGRNDPPVIQFVAPLTDTEVSDTYLVKWTDNDPDSAATIQLFLNNVLIQGGIPEDSDGTGDSFQVSLTNLAPGKYTVRLTISDGTSSISVTAPGALIKPDNQQIDSDGDGKDDATDNCPHFSNPGQKDKGTLLKKNPDGIGDACQCGDVDDNGVVNDKDVNLLEKVFAKKRRPPAFASEKCNIGGTSACTKKDAQLLDDYVTDAQKSEECRKKKKKNCPPMPTIPQVCDAAK